MKSLKRWHFPWAYLSCLLWWATVWLWPYPSNLDPTFRRPSAIGEGLYKADLTNTNFGLLGVRFYETSEGKKSWKIRSHFAELDRKENAAYLREVDGDFFARETGNVVWTKSDRGRSLLDANRLELEGNVNVRSKKGYLFSMRTLDYDGRSRKFVTASPVQMIGPNVENPEMHLAGVGMQGFLDREHFKVQKKVKAKRRLSTSNWLYIDSSAGEFFTQSERAVFTGSVTSSLPGLKIESQRFEFSSGQTQEVLLAEGKVTVFSRERKGTADRAEILVHEDAVLLFGNASVVDGGNVIRGEQITLFGGNDKVEVHRAIGSMER